MAGRTARQTAVKSLRSPQVSTYISVCLAFSLVVNLLLLVSPLYMLQIYDRVMTSGSVDALIWLSVMAVFLMAIYGAAEAGRRRTLSLAGDHFAAHMTEPVFRRYLDGQTAQPELSRDLALVSRVQSLIQSGMPTALCDAPFAPLFLILLAVLHPILGIMGLGGAVMVICVAVLSDFQSRRAGQVALAEEGRARRFAEGLERQHSAISSMGLGAGAKAKWSDLGDTARAASVEASTLDGAYSGLSRTIRQTLQIIALGVGAALALQQEISAGGIVAGSILMGRALAPIDQIVGGWRGIVRGRTAWRHLKAGLEGLDPAQPAALALPRPEAQLTVRRLSVCAPGTSQELIRSFSIEIAAGEIVSIVGANGAGKSTLLQLLSGAWRPITGNVFLGGRDIHAWPAEDRGQHVGYLPQQTELLPCSVRDNIARLKQDGSEVLFEAAHLAGAHESILGLPEGYETMVGPGGIHLSAGQAQRIGLARAFYLQAPAIFLDEPSANLDHIASAKLARSLGTLANAGSFIVLSTHDPRLLAVSKSILVVQDNSILRVPAEDYLRAQHAQMQAKTA